MSMVVLHTATLLLKKIILFSHSLKIALERKHADQEETKLTLQSL